MVSRAFSSAAQLSSAFSKGLPAQLSKLFSQLSSLSSGKSLCQLSSAIFFKICNSGPPSFPARLFVPYRIVSEAVGSQCEAVRIVYSSRIVPPLKFLYFLFMKICNSPERETTRFHKSDIRGIFSRAIHFSSTFESSSFLSLCFGSQKKEQKV